MASKTQSSEYDEVHNKLMVINKSFGIKISNDHVLYFIKLWNHSSSFGVKFILFLMLLLYY